MHTRSRRKKECSQQEGVALARDAARKATYLPTSESDDDDVNKSENTELEEDRRWVQCENLDCLKWRVISPTDADQLVNDASWFCHMNKDVLFSSCDTPEENFSSDYKLKQYGLTYRYSMLPEGSLVWAKLSGYCKWPAILCCPPGCPEYSILDVDGDPHSYHVEFLGTHHSIAWVHYTKLNAYGNLGKQEALETCSQPLSMISMNRFKTGVKKRRRSRLTSKKKVSVQLAEQLQSAIDEADGMLELEDGDRVKKCQYRYKEMAAEKDSKNSAQKMQVKKVKKKQVNKHSRSSPALPSSQISNQLTDHKLKDFSTREERLMADIQGLQVLEKEFMEDYATFMKKKRSSVNGPCWQGVNINLFQLFMSVQEKGGFNQVCASMRWKEVIQDCCDMVVKSNSAPTAMAYYSRNLLKYEMHVTGERSTHDLSKVQKKAKIRAVVAKSSKKKRSKKRKNEDTKGVIGGIVCEDETMKDLREIEDLLKEFDDEKEGLEDAPEISESHPEEYGMGIYFNDDSQPPAKIVDGYAPVLSQSQPKQDTCDGVDYAEIFGEVSPSQVVPEVGFLHAVDDNSGSNRQCTSNAPSNHSEEDLFAEIARDEKFLQSLLDTT